jgi:hypothetical protein
MAPSVSRGGCMARQVIRGIATALLVLTLFASRPGSAQEQRGPSTAEERARAVKVAHQLEEDPLGKDAKDQRAWMIQWIIEIPDITVNVCAEYFGSLPNPPRGHSQEVFTQMMLSSAAFMIEHPDKVKDEQAVALAGLLGSLKAYQAVLKQDPSAHWAYVDRLVRMRDQGKLDDYVTETRIKCKSDEQERDPDTMRAQASPLSAPSAGLIL